MSLFAFRPLSGKQKITEPQRPLRLCGELLQSILLLDYMDIMRRSGWEITHIIDCPMSLRAVGLRAGGHATVSGKHRSPDAKKPNLGDRSTFPDYRKKEVIFKFGFRNCGGHPKQLINSGLPLLFPQSSPSR